MLKSRAGLTVNAECKFPAMHFESFYSLIHDLVNVRYTDISSENRYAHDVPYAAYCELGLGIILRALVY